MGRQLHINKEFSKVRKEVSRESEEVWLRNTKSHQFSSHAWLYVTILGICVVEEYGVCNSDSKHTFKS